MLKPKPLSRLFLLFLALLVCNVSHGQKPTAKKSYAQKSSSGSSGSSGGNKIGLGIKAGDPTGLSVKFYQPKMAIEIVAGRPYYFSNRYYDRDYYYRRFYDYDKYKNHYTFDRYETHNPIALQIHFLKSKATKSAKELNWYYGGGPQFRAYRVNYYYREYYGPKSHDYYVLRDDYTYFDLGLDGVFGLEYTFSDIPISIFGDANIFLELADDPFNLQLQGGLGVRYNL